MTIDPKEISKLKQKATKLQREIDEAAGMTKQLMGNLKSEFDCDTLDDGKKLLKKIKKDATKAEETYLTARDKFAEDWGDLE